MADPRYRKGIFVGFDPNERRRQAMAQASASPLLFGWEPLSLLPDGRRLWGLEGHEGVTMHRMSDAEKTHFQVNDEWVVEIGGKPYASYSDTLEHITADVRAVLAAAEVAA